jgi:hypothetical protein
MRLAKINLINSVLIALCLSAAAAMTVSAATTFYDNPDDALIFAPIPAPASVSQTGGHGSRTANITTPAEINCAQDWICGDWSSCASGFQTRACADSNDCDNFHKKGDVSKVIAAQKPAELRDCKETALPKAEMPAQPAEAPISPQKTAPSVSGTTIIKLSISPAVIAIALLAIIAVMVVKFYLRRKGEYIIVYLHRNKQQDDVYHIKNANTKKKSMKEKGLL